MAQQKTVAHDDGASVLKKFHRGNRARQLATLQANVVRGHVESKAQLPVDGDLPPSVDVCVTNYANQVVMAPDGWGKTTFVSQLVSACEKDGMPQPLVVRCTGLSVRGATFRRAIREILVGLAQALHLPDKKGQQLASELKVVREALAALHGRSDVINKSVTQRREGTQQDTASQLTEASSSAVKEHRRERSSESTSSFTQTAASIAVGPFCAVAQMAIAAISSKKSSNSSTGERSETSNRSATTTSRSSIETTGLTEAYQELDDLKDHLDRLREDFRNLILRRQEILQRPATFLIFDDFDEIPMVAQPFVAEFFRILTTSVGGYVKIFGRPYRMNLYLEGDSESAGFRPERDIASIPTADRLLEFEAWESWLRCRLDEFYKLPHFSHGGKAHGRPQLSEEVLAHLALVSAGRPGLFYQIFARANEYAWEAHDVGARDNLVLEHADVDSALWLLQQGQAPLLARNIDPDALMPRILWFLTACAKRGSQHFFEVSRRELAWNQEFRFAIEQLVDQLVIAPVGLRVDEQGQFRVVYFFDPRTFASAEQQKPVPWGDVRRITVEQAWKTMDGRQRVVLPMTVPYLLDMGTPKKADATKALPLKEAGGE